MIVTHKILGKVPKNYAPIRSNKVIAVIKITYKALFITVLDIGSTVKIYPKSKYIHIFPLLTII